MAEAAAETETVAAAFVAKKAAEFALLNNLSPSHSHTHICMGSSRYRLLLSLPLAHETLSPANLQMRDSCTGVAAFTSIPSFHIHSHAAHRTALCSRAFDLSSLASSRRSRRWRRSAVIESDSAVYVDCRALLPPSLPLTLTLTLRCVARRLLCRRLPACLTGACTSRCSQCDCNPSFSRNPDGQANQNEIDSLGTLCAYVHRQSRSHD